MANSYFEVLTKIASFRQKFILKNKNYTFEESPCVLSDRIHEEIPHVYHFYFLHFENLSE
jgi:hypothetical protein